MLESENLSVPQERRHSTVLYKARAMSVRHLRDLTVKHMQNGGTPEPLCPSLEWLRLQFFPRNSFAKSSAKYRERFNMKLRLQKRILRKKHVDHHFGSKLFQYFKKKVYIHISSRFEFTKIVLGFNNVFSCVVSYFPFKV